MDNYSSFRMIDQLARCMGLESSLLPTFEGPGRAFGVLTSWARALKCRNLG